MFIELVGAIVVAEHLYAWTTAIQSMIIGRYLRSKYRDIAMQRHLQQMPVGRANFIMGFTK